MNFTRFELENRSLNMHGYFSLLSLFNVIASAYFVNFVFRSRTPFILISDKLVIRKQINYNKKMSLSIVIGNLNAFLTKTKAIRNVLCTIRFYYENDMGRDNSDFFLMDFIKMIENIHRFSFNIEEIVKNHPRILKNFLNQNSKDIITITLEGTSESGNKKFLVEKSYRLSDAIIDDQEFWEDIKEKYPVEKGGKRKSIERFKYRCELWDAVKKYPFKENESLKEEIEKEIRQKIEQARGVNEEQKKPYEYFSFLKILLHNVIDFMDHNQKRQR